MRFARLMTYLKQTIFHSVHSGGFSVKVDTITVQTMSPQSLPALPKQSPEIQCDRCQY